MKRYYLLFIFILSLICLPSSALANKLRIVNFGASEIDTTNNTLTFTFDISWDNSWRDDTNYDSA